MRIVGTLMVRDEVDIVAAMVEHHLAQDIDMLIVTDNASADGTTEVLEAYVETGRVELHHDPVHRKQQGTVVTGMARRARTHHRADWVLNLDADEFMVPVDRSLTLRDALEGTPLHLNAFTVPVTNLVGPAAWSGSGVVRLDWRDQRPDELLQAIGIHAQPTPNAVHRGESDVVVSQGNHFVSLVSNGQPPTEVATEVFHLPWRSWAQLELKVDQRRSGLREQPRPAAEPQPPRDARLPPPPGRAASEAYLARTPRLSELEEGARLGHYEHDEWLSKHLHSRFARARPDLLGPVVDPANDVPVPDAEHAAGAEPGRALLAAEAPVPARGWARRGNLAAGAPRGRSPPVAGRGRGTSARD